MLIGLDPSSTRFGVAIGGISDGAPRTHVWRLPGAGDDVFGRTLKGARQSVYELCRITRATHVVIEAPIHIPERSAHTMMALVQLAGSVREAAEAAECIVRLVAVSTVRKHFIGNGGLPSAEAKRATKQRCEQLRWLVEDDNAADAAATWAWGMATFFPAWSPKSTPLFASGRAA